MKKLIMVAVAVGGLLAGAIPVRAQVADPLSLATSGVLIPYLTEVVAGQATVATIEVASPVGPNPDVHMIFFNATCVRTGDSIGLDLTTNDIAFQQVGSAQGGPIVGGGNGIVAIAQVDPTGFGLTPLASPIHARIYLFNAADGRSRVVEPIILDSAEWPGAPHTWSPLRSGATFFAPQQTATVNTLLYLVCPRNSIQGSTAGVFPAGTFPTISPAFPSGAGVVQARIYDTNENFMRDAGKPCDCFTSLSVADLSTFYSDPLAVNGTYTELEAPPATGSPATGTTFTAERNVFTVGSPLNNFFQRMSTAGRQSLQGSLCTNSGSCR
jgi:hypothetical protein